MSLTDEQVKEFFELLKLASSEQRADFLAFNERLGSGDVSWTDNVTENDPPKEDTQ